MTFEKWALIDRIDGTLRAVADTRQQARELRRKLNECTVKRALVII
jgi:hypothetical protein